MMNSFGNAFQAHKQVVDALRGQTPAGGGTVGGNSTFNPMAGGGGAPVQQPTDNESMEKLGSAIGGMVKDKYFTPDAAKPMDLANAPQLVTNPFMTGAPTAVGDPFKDAASTNRGFSGMGSDLMGMARNAPGAIGFLADQAKKAPAFEKLASSPVGKFFGFGS
jgi:hypothetical protein